MDGCLAKLLLLLIPEWMMFSYISAPPPFRMDGCLAKFLLLLIPEWMDVHPRFSVVQQKERGFQQRFQFLQPRAKHGDKGTW